MHSLRDEFVVKVNNEAGVCVEISLTGVASMRISEVTLQLKLFSLHSRSKTPTISDLLSQLRTISSMGCSL